MIRQLSPRFRMLSLLALAATALWRVDSSAADPHARWEKEIRAFETVDLASPPPTNAVLFVGSSSIRLWETLAEDFKEFPTIRRGFGGSEMVDSLHFADRIVLPYRPRQIVVYAGENDLAAGHPPERVVADFQAFVRKVHAVLPKTRVTYIAMKPSPLRWRLADAMRAGNEQIAAFTRSDKRLSFVDVFNPMLGADGKPREELFVLDKLHLNQAGYALWRGLIRPHLVE